MNYPMNQPPPESWMEPYRTALVEFDRQQLPERIALAEKAIVNRLQTLPETSEFNRERDLALDALNALRDLKRIALNDLYQ